MLLQESAMPVCVFDAGTLRIETANTAMVRRLQYSLDELKQFTPLHFLAQADQGTGLASLLALLQNGKKRSVLWDTLYRRKNGSSCQVKLRIRRIRFKQQTAFIAFFDEPADHPARHPAQTGFDLRGIVANIPGMAYQILRNHDGQTTLPYVSEQSDMLLGIQAARLQKHPELFYELILPEDRPAYLAAQGKNGGSPLSFNWEGRIRVEAWKDVKWVNLRVSQRTVAEGVVWDGIMLNVTHSKLNEALLKQSRKQLSALTAHVESVKEQERISIAREIHDDLGGNLTAIKIGLSWLHAHIPQSYGKLRERTRYLDDVIDQTLDATHRIASNLHPQILDFGLVSALRWQLKSFAQNIGLPYEFLSSHEQIPLNPETSIALFRIVQEALTNVAKHAKATKVRVHLDLNGDDLRLDIADNGIGTKLTRTRHARKTFGVLGMAERAAALGGELIVSAAAGGGTLVSLSLPYNDTHK
jgi:signal transduction histidine kinase